MRGQSRETGFNRKTIIQLPRGRN